MWTSGQWMTERTGGSDVGRSETVAKRSPDGSWRLYGVKWFTSATTGEMTLTLARPEGNGEGGRGLALFYLELYGADGKLNGIQIHRLKDKLGTRKVPTAELTLDGALAVPVAGLADGVRNIASMLNVTRAWNAGGAIWGMRRGLALARDYARRRRAFGDLLVQKPLHVDTLAALEAELAGAFLLTFRTIELMGRREAGVADEREQLLLRVITPLAKLTTGKQAVAVASETLEAFGGAGYVEDTGLPVILRDSQVLPIWEGTTNVLSLDTLRALQKDGTIEALTGEIRAQLGRAGDPSLKPAVEAAAAALAHASDWLGGALNDPRRVEAGARRFALTLGRTLELALLCAHAQWALEHGHGPRSAAAARLLARTGVDQIASPSLDQKDDAALLV
jgi:alkylation response protein AidB-like acyl-CoA dehydrogenase